MPTEVDDVPSFYESLGVGFLFLTVGLFMTAIIWRSLRPRLPDPPTPHKHFEPLSILEALLFLFGTMAVALQGLRLLDPEREEMTAGQGLAIMIVAQAVPVLYLMARHVFRVSGPRGDLSSFGFKKTPLWPSVILVLLMYGAFLPVAIGVAQIERGLYGAFGAEPPTQMAVEALQSDGALAQDALFLTGVCLLVPFLEELLYRGFLYAAIRRYMNAFFAIALNGMIFMSMHDAGRSEVFSIGCLLAFLYEKTRSVWVVTGFHVLHNVLTIIKIKTMV